jgi:hypothetical protein
MKGRETLHHYLARTKIASISAPVVPDHGSNVPWRDSDHATLNDKASN